MEQFFIILAVVIFMLFRGASSGGRRRVPGQDPFESGPVTKGGLDAALEDANRRAMEALQRWEAKQRGEEPEPQASAPPTSATRREPLPTARRERPPRVTLNRSAAERERKEAYADIASMLDPARRKKFKPRPRPGVGRHRRSPEPEADAEPAVSAPAAAPESRTRPYGSREPTDRRRARRRGPAAALARIEKLPLGARAIVYAEILGRARGTD